jgi:neutral ceramidase
MAVRAGFASVDITPSIGTPMSGYPDVRLDLDWTPDAMKGYVGRRRQVSEGVHDALLATAGAFEVDGEPLVVLGLDTLAVTSAFTDAVRDALDVPRERVLIAASHTHGGPDLFAWWEGELSAAPAGATLERTIAAAERALQRLEPAEVAWGEARLDHVSVNRRDEAGGPIDDAVGVLRATSLRHGDALGQVVGFACHPVTLDYANLLFTADWVGPMRGALGALYPGSTSVFVNGAAGNLNPRRFPFEERLNIYIPQTAENYPVYWGGFADAARIGHSVAAAAAIAWERAVPVAPAPPSGRLAEVRLPLKQDVELTQYLDFMAFADDYRASLSGDALRSEVQLVTLGPLRLLGLPGEVFTEIGLDLRVAAGEGPLLLAGYANDDVRYVMTDDAYVQGEYETVGTPLAVGSADALRDAATALLRS